MTNHERSQPNDLSAHQPENMTFGRRILSVLGIKKDNHQYTPHSPDRVAVIDRQEFEAAQKDPELKKFLKEAQEEGERLRLEGKIHP